MGSLNTTDSVASGREKSNAARKAQPQWGSGLALRAAVIAAVVAGLPGSTVGTLSEYDCVDALGHGDWNTEHHHWEWEPRGAQECGFHYLNSTEAGKLLAGKRLTFLGNSVQRRTMWAIIDILRGGNETWHPKSDEQEGLRYRGSRAENRAPGEDGWDHTFNIHDEDYSSHSFQNVHVGLKTGKVWLPTITNECSDISYRTLEINEYLYMKYMAAKAAGKAWEHYPDVPAEDMVEACQGLLNGRITFEGVVRAGEPPPRWVQLMRQLAPAIEQEHDDPRMEAAVQALLDDMGVQVPAEEMTAMGIKHPFLMASADAVDPRDEKEPTYQGRLRGSALHHLPMLHKLSGIGEPIGTNETDMGPPTDEWPLHAGPWGTGVSEEQIGGAGGKEERVNGVILFQKREGLCAVLNETYFKLKGDQVPGLHVTRVRGTAECQQHCRYKPVKCPKRQHLEVGADEVVFDYMFSGWEVQMIDHIEDWRNFVGFGADVAVIAPNTLAALKPNNMHRIAEAITRNRIEQKRVGLHTKWIWRGFADFRPWGKRPSDDFFRYVRQVKKEAWPALTAAGVRVLDTTNATIRGVSHGALMHEEGSWYHFDDRGRQYMAQMILNALMTMKDHDHSHGHAAHLADDAPQRPQPDDGSA